MADNLIEVSDGDSVVVIEEVEDAITIEEVNEHIDIEIGEVTIITDTQTWKSKEW